MDINDIDFTGSSSNQNNNGGGQNGGDPNNNGGDPNNNNNNGNQNGNDNGDGNGNGDGNSNGNNANGNDENNGNGNQNNGGDGNGSHEGDGNSQVTELKEGDIIELGDDKYTVDKIGNLIDSKGNIFKQKAEIADWLKQYQQVNNNGDKGDNKDGDGDGDGKNNAGNDKGLTLQKVQELVGIDVLDDKDQPVQFTDDEAGIKSYLNAVSEKQINDAATGAVNKFLDNNPYVKDFVNYLIVNNGNPYGYGQLSDSSKIIIDKDNQSQQEAIVRHAAEVFNNPMVNDTYIKYLKDSGNLLNEAKSSLELLVNSEKKYREDLENKAKAQQEQQRKDVEDYWNNVSAVISSGIIGDFTIPEAFTKEVDGRKMTYNRNDFFDYLSRASIKDEQGNLITPYQRDLAKLDDKEVLNREILNGWLLFTGGTLKDLAKIMTKANEVRNIRLQAKDNSAHKTIVLKQNNNQSGGYRAEDIAFS